MFALFALAGDIGCAGGPLVVGRISGVFGDDLRIGILAALVFPVILTVGVLASGRVRAVPGIRQYLQDADIGKTEPDSVWSR